MKSTVWIIRAVSASAASLLLASGAAGQSIWNYTTNPCDVPGACSATGGDPTTVTVTPYGGYTSGANFVVSDAIRSTGTSGLTNQGGSGIGFTSKNGAGTVETTNSPNHAFDNYGGSGTSSRGATTEMLLINFSAKVDLTSIAIGWGITDTDLSLLRWDGSGSPLSGTDLVDKNGSVITNGTSGLTAINSGWSLVNSRDMDNAATSGSCLAGTTSASCETGSKSWTISGNNGAVSSWWMISTYFGATTGSNGQKLDTGNDFFKIASFAGNVCAYSATTANGSTCEPPPPPNSGGGSTPEPTSLALVGLALLGAKHARRVSRKRPS